jgi:hypothetical protein
MSGHIGLREDGRIGRWLALRIAALFPPRRLAPRSLGWAKQVERSDIQRAM